MYAESEALCDWRSSSGTWGTRRMGTRSLQGAATACTPSGRLAACQVPPQTCVEEGCHFHLHSKCSKYCEKGSASDQFIRPANACFSFCQGFRECAVWSGATHSCLPWHRSSLPVAGALCRRVTSRGARRVHKARRERVRPVWRRALVHLGVRGAGHGRRARLQGAQPCDRVAHKF